MINKLRFLCLLLIFMFAFVAFSNRDKFEHVNYSEYILESKYFTDDNYLLSFKELKNILIDDEEVKSASDLINKSKYALIVKISENPTMIGDGIINNGIIVSILKGDKFKIGDSIKIYDLLYSWGVNSTNYLGGATPVRVGDTYVVFITDEIRPTVEGTYAFSSVKYGHFNISRDIGTYSNYDLSLSDLKLLTVSEAMNYDYVFSPSDPDVGIHFKIKDELLNRYIEK